MCSARYSAAVNVDYSKIGSCFLQAHRLNNAPPGAAWEVGTLLKGGLLMSTALAALDTDNLLPHSMVLSNSAHAGKVVSLAQLRSLPLHIYHELAMNYMMDVGSALMKVIGLKVKVAYQLQSISLPALLLHNSLLYIKRAAGTSKACQPSMTAIPHMN